jgi:hypothetical protein
MNGKFLKERDRTRPKSNLAHARYKITSNYGRGFFTMQALGNVAGRSILANLPSQLMAKIKNVL